MSPPLLLLSAVFAHLVYLCSSRAQRCCRTGEAHFIDGEARRRAGDERLVVLVSWLSVLCSA